MAITVTNTYLDYSTGYVVVTLATPFTGSEGDRGELSNVLSRRQFYCSVDAMLKTSKGIKFDAATTRSFNHDAMINT